MNVKLNENGSAIEVYLDGLSLIEYQIGMINENDSIKAIPLEKLNFNGEIIMNCDISDKISLKDYFESTKVSKFDLLSLIIQIGETVLVSNDYLLNVKNFLIDPRFIFLGKKSLDVSMIYVPVKENINTDINEKFRSLISEIIVNLARVEEKDEADPFMGVLLNTTKNKESDIEVFLNKSRESINKRHEILEKIEVDIKKEESKKENIYIEKLEKPKKIEPQRFENFNYEINKTENTMPIENNRLNPINNRQEHINNINQNQSRAEAEQGRIDNNFRNRNSGNSFFSEESKNNNFRRESKPNKPTNELTYTTKEIYPLWRKITAGCIQLIFVPTLLLLIFIGLDLTTLVGVGIVVVVIDAITLRILLHPDSKKKVKVLDKSNPSKTNSNSKNREKSFINTGKKEIATQNAYETEVLDSSLSYFVLQNGGIAERIYINKESFIIGRLGNECDYVVNNNTIGKVHLKVMKMNKFTYIEDLNSKNGTFINGERVASGKAHKIFDNYEIKLANTVLIYKDK